MKYIITILICLTAGMQAAAGSFSLPLTQGWSFRDADSGVWRKATVPGTVHTDLLRHHCIPDPFYRDNEAKVQWVARHDWEYRTRFRLTPEQLSSRQLSLVFEGLDTYVDVFLNGRPVLQADNMFRTWKVPVKQWVKEGGNELRILFHSAVRRTDSLAAAALPLVRPCENNRHYARKAQYHFGWDWAPRLVTAGIWRRVTLQGADEEREDLSDAWKKDLKKVNLVQEPDSAGRSFYFTINGKPVFMKGANWIPADVFLPRVDKAKYRSLLRAAKDAHFNMLRVWGGGIYEDDAFYDLCDSLGIMVWQDFMFAGAMYPGDAHFLESVKQEAIDNIRRLRHHPCIVLWCGNNELDEAWHNWGWQRQFRLSNEDSARLWQDYVHLFRELLPGLVQEYDGTRPYVSTSPMHGWGRNESMTEGDSHYWGVWWGVEPIEKYREKVPRFMSEYGMQSMPDWQTIRSFSLPADRDTATAVMKAHQKHPTGYTTLSAYQRQLGYAPKDFRAFAAASQEVQSRALETAIHAHLQAAPYCMGSLFWQFNDCWPVSSWSVIDYYGRKKKAYYMVQRAYSTQPAKRRDR